ncbi:MAG: hypothetical protein A3G38_01895 [Omnitrophica WOR_2 bacterium RIFCSPLOWO2_12_FULL_51_8]|nr:MAG: hypothetical protein A3G38_01895 [Omnitrophica WOR_2 bacterium RIFCSPLOWO2_12_FULL_51_8]
MVYLIFRFICFILAKLVFRLEIRGRENIPRKGGFILASNHTSFLDPVILGVGCPRRLNFMARSSLFRNHAFGWLLTRLNVFPLKRGEADIGALKAAMARVRKGAGLLIFPEGTRRPVVSKAEGRVESFDLGLGFDPEQSRRVEPQTNQPGDAQPGVGFLAAKLHTPVIPAFIQGTDRAMPRGVKFIHPVKVKLIFGKQILIERGMPYRVFAGNLMKNIGHLSCSIT